MSKRMRSSKEEQRLMDKKMKIPRFQLSDLPMDILHSIVSRLPIRQAVRTSILSNHWKHVWCSRPNLEFSFMSLVYKKGSGIPRSHISEYVFIERVDAVLRQHSGIGVEKLEVDFSPLHNEHTEHIDGWVKFAIASKTKQLILDFGVHRRGKEPYNFPFQLFDATNASHLQSMKLGSISLKQPASFNFFLNLKKLELVDLNITDEELKLMLLSCHVLEFIGISHCKMLTHVDTSNPMNCIKHLQVSQCLLLQGMGFCFGLVNLEFEGPVMKLVPPSTLRNISMTLSDICSAVEYMFTELPSTLHRLETLTIRSEELKRATLPNRPINFLHLRHLRLELSFVFLGLEADVLDLACLLQAAPIMEKLEIHMLVDHKLQRYRKCHGELRSLPSHRHFHLKLVNITGFYGQKAQLELALHILKNSSMLKAMNVVPKPAIDGPLLMEDRLCFLDGYKVAKKYLCKSHHHGIVGVTKVHRRDVENVDPCHLIVNLTEYVG